VKLRQPTHVTWTLPCALLFVLLLIFAPLWAQSGVVANEPAGGGSAADTQSQPGTLTLEDLLKEVGQNPALQSSQFAAEASRVLIAPARALPNPTVTFEHMGDIIPFQRQAGDPSSANTYGVEQEIPFPGKRGLKGQIASAEAEGQQWSHQATHLQVISEVKQAFYDLYLIHKSIELQLENKDLLQKFEEIAESRYRVGQTMQQDVIRAQVELSKVLDRLLGLAQKKRIAEARINTLLHKPPENPLGKPAEVKKSELKYSLDELTQLALANSPALKVQDSEVSRRVYSAQLAKKEFYPDFAVGFTFFDRRDNPEMYRLMFSAKLPLYFWQKQGPELDAARLNVSSAQMMRESAATTVRFQVKEAHTNASTAERLANLYFAAIIPQATLSLSSAISSYEVGRLDFLRVIDAQTALIEYRMKYFESGMEFQKALAQLEPLTGVELTN
jgi:cobalt-zinc-cadmium efflux system outer membrane protein